jgi:hypothetical protein
MKPQPANSVVVSVRCTHRTSGGRRCRLSVSDPRSVLCPQHRAEQLEAETADHHTHLIRNFHHFQTAQGINNSLNNLYQLLAQNRISPRRAAVLSYISSLLLRTLPQIDSDRAAGIFDPSKPKPISVPVSVPAEDADTQDNDENDEDGENAAEIETEGSDLELDSDADSDSGLDSGADSGSGLVPDPGSTNSWDPSIPEPDPKKKPS